MKLTRHLLLGLAILLVALVAPDRSEAVKAPRPGGQFSVGVKVMRAEIDGRVAPFLVWYPAEASASKPYAYGTEISLAAVENAAPDKSAAPYPLILFSHGINMNHETF